MNILIYDEEEKQY